LEDIVEAMGFSYRPTIALPIVVQALAERVKVKRKSKSLF